MAENEAEVIQLIKSRTDAFYEALIQGDPMAAASFFTSDG
jgi:hypothetical protein